MKGGGREGGKEQRESADWVSAAIWPSSLIQNIDAGSTGRQEERERRRQFPLSKRKSPCFIFIFFLTSGSSHYNVIETETDLSADAKGQIRMSDSGLLFKNSYFKQQRLRI